MITLVVAVGLFCILGVAHFLLIREVRRGRFDDQRATANRFTEHGQQTDSHIAFMRDELLAALNLNAEVQGIAREVQNERLRDQAQVLSGLVAFLDDVPQNFAFHKSGVTYKLHLPDRLRMVLSREG